MRDRETKMNLVFRNWYPARNCLCLHCIPHPLRLHSEMAVDAGCCHCNTLPTVCHLDGRPETLEASQSIDWPAVNGRHREPLSRSIRSGRTKCWPEFPDGPLRNSGLVGAGSGNIVVMRETCGYVVCDASNTHLKDAWLLGD